MSIKTVGSNVTSNSKGLEKKINKGAERLVFDILQSSQYSTPISSSVRELTTNALDAQREKEIAIEILTGKKSIEDYYITRDGEQYTDSNFDRSYYDLNYLDAERNDVILRYTENEGTGFCDEFSVEDFGVGIGGNRLLGMSELGYSTKRNTSENFGAFGLGSKVALSTGVDFYVVESAYNGKYVKFQCFAYKTVFLVSKWEADGEIKLNEENTVYYKNYSGKNFTKVSFGVKKHNRNAFNEAITDQLTYVPGVKLLIKKEGGTGYFENNFYDAPIYNSSNIIVCEGSYYGRPHIVIVKSQDSLTGINYGYVQFRELEMEQLFGAVGLKCPIRQAYLDENNNEIVVQEGVEVTPSREKVIWNDNTKKFVEEIIDKAHTEISELVNSELGNEGDILEWLKKCAVTIHAGSRTGEIKEETKSITLLGKLSRFLDTDKIKPKFSIDKSIEYKGISSLLPYYTVTKLYVPSGLNAIKVSDVYYWNQINLDNLYFLSTQRSTLRDWYLIGNIVNEEKAIYILRENSQKINSVSAFTLLDPAFNALRASEEKILNYIKLSKHYKSYEDVEVPSDFKLPNGIREGDSLASVLTPEEMRQMNGEIVAFTIREDINRYSRALVYDKIQPIQKDFLTSETLTYYGLQEDRGELEVAYRLLEKFNPAYYSKYSWNSPAFYWDKRPVRFASSNDFKLNSSERPHKAQIIKISEKTEKIVHANPNIKHISNLFWEDKGDGTMVLHPLLKLYFTKMYSSNIRNWVHYYIPDIIPEFKEVCFVIKHLFGSTANFTKDEISNCILLENLEKFANSKYFLNKSLPDYEEQLQNICEDIFKLDIKDIDIFYDDILEISTFAYDFAGGINSLMEKMDTSASLSYNKSSSFNTELQAYLGLRGKLDMEIPKCLPSAVAIISENLTPCNND